MLALLPLVIAVQTLPPAVVVAVSVQSQAAPALHAQLDHDADGLRRTAPRYLTHNTARDHVVAAKTAATKEIAPELLLGMAYVESRYDVRSVSRVHKASGKRQTGIIAATTKPKSIRGPFFCGPLQTIAGHSWQTCLAQRNLTLAYATAATELTRWLKACRRKGYTRSPLDCALRGYGGGWKAAERGTSTYPQRVRGRANKIKKSWSTTRRPRTS